MIRSLGEGDWRRRVVVIESAAAEEPTLNLACHIGSVESMELTFDHEKLDVYRVALEFVAWAFRICQGLPAIHKNTKDQLLDSSQSIVRNIAEGNGKRGWVAVSSSATRMARIATFKTAGLTAPGQTAASSSCLRPTRPALVAR